MNTDTPQTLIILAAGLGSRLGRAGGNLHKALVPIAERSALTRIIEATPSTAEIIVVVAHKADQIEDYLSLAHRGRCRIAYTVPPDAPGAGPGRSFIDGVSIRQMPGDVIVTACDTLVPPEQFAKFFNPVAPSLVAVAPIPPGTRPERWCRILEGTGSDNIGSLVVLEKLSDASPYYTNHREFAYTGLVRVRADDVYNFMHGVARPAIDADTTGIEPQLTGGLVALANHGTLRPMRVDWTDIGDARAYMSAVAAESGYDWTKTDQATFVIEPRVVVKYFEDPGTVRNRVLRGRSLGSTRVPYPLLPAGGVYRPTNFFSYGFIIGRTGYEVVEAGSYVIEEVIDAAMAYARGLEPVPDLMRSDVVSAAVGFYFDKTHDRISKIRDDSQRIAAAAAFGRVNPATLIENFDPAMIHGDFNLGNVIFTGSPMIAGSMLGIDWRESFAGYLWGDRYYDFGKFLAGLHINWGRARRGDFSPWTEGIAGAQHMRDVLQSNDEEWNVIETIAAVSLLNCAPLHEAPLDSILVARGVEWLNRITAR